MGLESIVRAKLLELVPGADALAADVRRGRAEEPEAVFLYGSRLAETMRSPTSVFDVYAVAGRLARFHGPGIQAALNTLLPPNVYSRASAELRYKLCVVSRRQMDRETSPRARDLYHLGRFSKRVALAWARDDAAVDRAVSWCASAVRALVPHARARLGERFALDDFARALLGLSYLAETRVDEGAKVAALYEVERGYYRALFAAALAEADAAWPLERTGDAYAQPPPEARARRRVERLIRRSRRRARLRWPKHVLTFDGWLDYLLEKVERHQGIRVELSARERRWPLLFAWPKYFALRRKGIVK